MTSIAALLALAILFLAAAAAPAATKLTIAHPTVNPRIGPLWIADSNGLFKKYGIDATILFVRNAPLMIAAMKTGSVPNAYGGGSGIVGASSAEADMRVLATFTGR